MDTINALHHINSPWKVVSFFISKGETKDCAIGYTLDVYEKLYELNLMSFEALIEVRAKILYS